MEQDFSNSTLREINMKANISTTKDTDKDNIDGQMEIYIMDSLLVN